MTTFLLNQAQVEEATTLAKQVLGEKKIRSGRYRHRGSHVCDFVISLEPSELIIFCSGNFQFKITLGDRFQKLIPVGATKDHNVHFIFGLFRTFAESVLKERKKLEARRKTKFVAYPDRIGSGFSVKADDSKLKEMDKIDHTQSTRNFKIAIKMKFYHKSFVNFCEDRRVKCYYKSVEE